ncbi:MAG: hypothetical protein KGQ46_12400 [Hyphomicrobiales bacterium]|nr:hypothetical protein [Hyphomicrobiales bacterium]MDE2113839.1 hypothetical protein [Hyphomicrobiales bacterium]
MQPDDLIAARGETHGNFDRAASCAQRMKFLISNYGDDLSCAQKEALQMIATKMARILVGDASHADHWDDIAGYAMLGKGGGNE